MSTRYVPPSCTASLMLLSLLGYLCCGAPPASDLERGFIRPPDAAKPWAYWWWLNGNVSRAGITKDLAEMKRQGINGALIFHAGGAAGPMPGGVRFLSPEWRELFKHALREAARLNMEVSVNLCDGWDAGGPWITAEQANKKLVYSELPVAGSRRVSHVLPAPPVVDGYYREVAVVAFPEKDEPGLVPARVTASSTLAGYCEEWNRPPADAADRDPETCWASGNVVPSPSQPAWLTLEFSEPMAAVGVYVAPAAENGPRDCELQRATDGETFSTICRFTLEQGQAKRVEFPQVQAPQFRLLITSAYGAPVQVAEVMLLRKDDEPHLRRGIKWWWCKSANRSFWDWPQQGPAVLDEEYPEDGAWDCPAREVLDLTSRINPQGRIEWDAPPGRWTVLRFGYTLQGQKTRCGDAIGYEADMLSAKGIESHFANTAEPLLKEAAAAGGKALKFLHIDSYELGADVRGQQPTWAETFREEFKARRGYDLLPYLPVLARRIVDSREVSDRFLWDFRRTIGDLMAERFFGRFRELAHARGVGVHCETGYGTYPFPHIDGLRCAGMSDVPMGEFWHGTDIMSQFNPWGNVIRTVASAAHVYGRQLVQAESFTSWNHWMESPQSLKPVGDEAFCDGLNRMVFHQYTHQPRLDMKPGWQYGAGTHFDRNLTWWEQSRAFFLYLARCQHLLQQGRFVADVCCFYGEGVTKFVPGKDFLKPPLPAGYNFDCVNADVLLNRLSVKEGRLVLPDGLTYRLLVLPEATTLSPPVLRKIADLVKAGAVVVGPKPVSAPGLTGYPQSDAEVRRLAAELWRDCDGQRVKERRLGKGRVTWGKLVREVLLAERVPPDFEQANPVEGAPELNFIHRIDGETDLYFVANRRNVWARGDCTFRVGGKQPELWDPVSGETHSAEAFRQQDRRTTLPLELAPHGSLFVVFRKPIGLTAAGRAARNFPVYVEGHELTGEWRVKFDSRWGGPESALFDRLVSWTQRPEEGISHYSGKATYQKTVDLPSAFRRPGRRIVLELGAVKDVAEVRLNGTNLGVVWTEPFRVDITEAVRPVGNALEIDVVNLWPNRLIGDAALPPEKRFTQSNVQFSKDHPLLESGLLGPVRLRVAE